MQLLQILYTRQLAEGETLTESQASVNQLPRGTTKTGIATRFRVSVIINGEAVLEGQSDYVWELLGFGAEYYGFGRRVHMQVARDGLCMVEHEGRVITFAKVAR